MVKGFYKDAAKLLKQNGWIKLRSGKGSHEIWQNKETKRKITVPHGLTSRHTFEGILKSAGIEFKK